ncbi:putative amidohydrolase [Agrobacterium rubi TR3 = NBRC 13261]|uniref:Putative amidohydrolase n=1 Tax=Agrobacterium rubi TR3 = NBRC 13261 TaxID=1368415 RepID=A0A081D220_9HYPH|nr:amidohydrolase family protein [Agrobacterium rubi]MBP1880993.1 L-fuconolactonase [Agrobacterium rubi]GAK72966.1 putative amidohydrolase [Agrobacterium rubi TR3 = NBRC 13261]
MLDSHQHFWTTSRTDYGWLTPELGSIYRDFMPDDLRREMRRAGVTRTILVQAAETEAETDFLLDIAAKTDFVAGVVGWLDLDSDDFESRLTNYRANPLFVGVRPMLQGLPDDDFILRPRVLKSLKAIEAAGVPFDILTFTRHLPHVLRALEHVPPLKAVVDHISKPEIATGQFEPWASHMRDIAAFPNVSCKISGMVTEASPDWQLEDFRRYVDHVASVFGADRLMFGSDWPVCLLAASYSEVCNLARMLLSDHFDSEQLTRIFETNAAAFYGVGGQRR